jgi:hypothetical protein
VEERGRQRDELADRGREQVRRDAEEGDARPEDQQKGCCAERRGEGRAEGRPQRSCERVRSRRDGLAWHDEQRARREHRQREGGIGEDQRLGERVSPEREPEDPRRVRSTPGRPNEQREPQHRRGPNRGAARARELSVEPRCRHAEEGGHSADLDATREARDPDERGSHRSHERHDGEDEVRPRDREQVRQAALLEGEPIRLVEICFAEDQRSRHRGGVACERRFDPRAHRGPEVVDRRAHALASRHQRRVEDTPARDGARDRHAQRRVGRSRVVEALDRRELDDEPESVASSHLLGTVVDPNMDALRDGALARAPLDRDIEHAAPRSKNATALVRVLARLYDRRAHDLGEQLTTSRRSQRGARALVRPFDLDEPCLGPERRGHEQQHGDDEGRPCQARANDEARYRESEHRRDRLEHERGPERASTREDEHGVEPRLGLHVVDVRKPRATSRPCDFIGLRWPQGGDR